MINNIKNKKITIIGCGISGIGAANLANQLEAKVLISDSQNNTKINSSISDNIKTEFGGHSKKCFDSDLAVISPGINYNEKIIQEFLDRKIPLMTEIEFASQFTDGKIIGITGSNGKSTTVTILKAIFDEIYKNTYLGGNIGISFSHNVLKEIKYKSKNTIHILELSSFQLEHIGSFKTDFACFLNISSDHLDRHLTFENYFNIKKNIIKSLHISNKFLYNADDYYLNQQFATNKSFQQFSISNNNNLIYIKDNFIFDKILNEAIIDCDKIHLQGKHNLQNIIAAITIAKAYDIQNKNISRAIKSVRPLEHRLEKRTYNNIDYINDSKSTNIESTISALCASSKKSILILGGYSKTKINYAKKLKKFISNVQKIVCYGEAGLEIEKALNKIIDCKYIEKFSDAILYSLKIVRTNEQLLLSPGCASYDQFSNFEQRGNKFKELVRKNYL